MPIEIQSNLPQSLIATQSRTFHGTMQASGLYNLSSSYLPTHTQEQEQPELGQNTKVSVESNAPRRPARRPQARVVEARDPHAFSVRRSSSSSHTAELSRTAFPGIQDFVAATAPFFLAGPTKRCGNCISKKALACSEATLPGAEGTSPAALEFPSDGWEHEALNATCADCEAIYCRGCWISAPETRGCEHPATCRRRHALAIFQILCALDEHYLDYTAPKVRVEDDSRDDELIQDDYILVDEDGSGSPTIEGQFLGMHTQNDGWAPNTLVFISVLRHLNFYIEALHEADQEKEDHRWLIRRLFELSFLPTFLKEAFTLRYWRNDFQEKYKDLYVVIFRLVKTLSIVHPDVLYRDTAMFRSNWGLKHFFEHEGQSGILWESGGWVVPNSNLWLSVEAYAKVAPLGIWRSDGWDWMEGDPREYYKVAKERQGRVTRIRELPDL
ncbi:hypothetical protein CYLTODRAFT_490240 [Cylindrobasidium torrendii FP15055 ss-10]|uniref:Uncharacterized protein n=1 Tax=Cylindrobasidium torrendii FP15055 ss-10 TaxID=1314674 RepID=A0A0D7BBL5_9AGAR|nr:hypothetical protein CYLTODRAFT_490240 [Cylindrobasidium torrendii FP15055 ss-10]